MTKCNLILMGGFGNQLFQINHSMVLGFAAPDIFLDVQYYRNDSYKREIVLLSVSRFRVQRLSRSIVFFLKFLRFLRGIFLTFTSPKASKDICLSFPFPSRTFLYGYFQNPVSISIDLLSTLDLWLMRQYQSRISDSSWLIGCAKMNSTLVFHCRGGDYINCSKASSIYCRLGSDYYSEALRIAQESERVKVVIIVTDDARHSEYILGKLEGNFSSHVISSSLADDMFLMSRAKNLVIANSTFSLWSAYLCSHRGGHVYCPSAWFLDPRLQRPFFYKSWTILP